MLVNYLHIESSRDQKGTALPYSATHEQVGLIQPFAAGTR